MPEARRALKGQSCRQQSTVPSVYAGGAFLRRGNMKSSVDCEGGGLSEESESHSAQVHFKGVPALDPHVCRAQDLCLWGGGGGA